jgi:hypothetical protein
MRNSSSAEVEVAHHRRGTHMQGLPIKGTQHEMHTTYRYPFVRVPCFGSRVLSARLWWNRRTQGQGGAHRVVLEDCHFGEEEGDSAFR